MSPLLRNHVTVSGHGTRPMIFAHGFGCDQNMWRAVAPAFEEDYRVVLFDHVGAGKSDLSAYDPAKYATLNGYATNVLEICAELDLRDAQFAALRAKHLKSLHARFSRHEHPLGRVPVSPWQALQPASAPDVRRYQQ